MANFSAVAKVKIVTSITPIASLIAMLMDDAADISVIASGSDCPHHYHTRPSDLSKIKNADMIIYISGDFDGFITKLAGNYPGPIIKISEFNALHFLKLGRDINWHIWLDLDNVYILLEQLSQVFIKQFPAYSANIRKNLVIAKEQIALLARAKTHKLSSLVPIILLSDSTEYFFKNTEQPVTKLYQQNYNSLKYITRLESLFNQAGDKCLVLSTDQDATPYKKYNAIL